MQENGAAVSMEWGGEGGDSESDYKWTIMGRETMETVHQAAVTPTFKGLCPMCA